MMCFINMFRFFCAIIILFVFTDVQCQEYQYLPLVKGWFYAHKVRTTWDKAYQQCKDEGAVLAAPLTAELAYGMKSVMGDNKQSIQYYTDMKARFVPGVFVSRKSILLEDLPVKDMIKSLDASIGNCTSMDRDTINVVSCDATLPYICYREHDENETLTECGTYDKEYKFSELTGSCYKLHENELHWEHAYTTCIAEGGYLAILNDANEAKVVERVVYVNDTYEEDVLRKMGSFSHIVTVGIKKDSGNYDWFSIHGDNIMDMYNVWDRTDMSTDGNQCAGIKRHKPSSLSTFDCDNIRPFVCEKNPNTIRFKTE